MVINLGACILICVYYTGVCVGGGGGGKRERVCVCVSLSERGMHEFVLLVTDHQRFV